MAESPSESNSDEESWEAFSSDDEQTDESGSGEEDRLYPLLFGMPFARVVDANGYTFPLISFNQIIQRNQILLQKHFEMMMSSKNEHNPWSNDADQIKSMSVDRLFDISNPYYLGNYQQCINEASKFQAKTDEEKEAKNVFMYLSYIAQGKSTIPLSEIPENTDTPSLRGVRRFAEFQNPSKRQKIVAQVEAELSEGKFVADEANCITAAAMLNQTGNSEDALRALFKVDTLHTKAAAVQTLLKMNRIDLAIQHLKKMSEIDEDATLSQLALAWVNMAVGKDKLKDAFYIYQEMMDKYGQTVLLLVGQASALIMQQKYEEAEKLLQEAQQRDSNNAEALVNLIIVSERLGKGDEVTKRYIAQMKDSHPNHPWTVDLIAKEDLFNRIAGEASA